MKRFIECANREQSTLLPESLDEWIDDSNPVRAVDVFVDGLNLVKLGFDGVVPEATGRPSYHPSALLKLGTESRIVLCSEPLCLAGESTLAASISSGAHDSQEQRIIHLHIRPHSDNSDNVGPR